MRCMSDEGRTAAQAVAARWRGFGRVAALLALVLAGAGPGAVQAAGQDYSSVALRVADSLLAQQDAAGAISDAPDGETVDEDSNMEYALIGIAAAYWHSGDARYLQSLERGIRWLAAREDMSATMWRGSFAYGYQAVPPYAPVAVSPGPGVRDARGVDATSALFVYLLYLDATLAHSSQLARDLQPQARAALNFVLTRNLAADGFSNSSWQLLDGAGNGPWVLWRFEYSADQADVYLGLHAGGMLYRYNRYERAAVSLKKRVPRAFFLPQLGRYALGREPGGAPGTDFDGFDGIFPQGYLPWVFGPGKESAGALAWLSNHGLPDGSLSAYPGDPRFSLSVVVYALAANALHAPTPTGSLDWLIAHTYDPSDGGIGDSAQDSSRSSNVAGFTIAALLGFPAFPG